MDTAMPPDVRKRFALPLSGRTDLGCAQTLGVAREFNITLPEGRRPSAHQTAQPSLCTTFEAKPLTAQVASKRCISLANIGAACTRAVAEARSILESQNRIRKIRRGARGREMLAGNSDSVAMATGKPSRSG
jgi:hypothetical protein